MYNISVSADLLGCQRPQMSYITRTAGGGSLNYYHYTSQFLTNNINIKLALSHVATALIRKSSCLSSVTANEEKNAVTMQRIHFASIITYHVWVSQSYFILFLCFTGELFA